MYTIIPLINFNATQLDLEEANASIIGLNTISKLIAYDKYPIKNKRIAIDNILSFLKYIDSLKKDEIYKIPLSSKILTSYFTCNYYKQYMEILKELNILNKIPYEDGTFYTIGETTLQYKFFNEYLNDELCIVLINEDKFDLVIDYKTRYNSKFIKAIKSIEVDYNGAINAEIAYCNNNPKKCLRKRLNTLLLLNQRRFIYTGFKVDRVYHCLSNISKISRKFITVNKEEFNDIDVKTCQPLLLCYLIKKLNLQLEDTYKHDCETGIIYDLFVKPDRNRDATKTEMYRTIYFDLKPYSDTAKEFKERYPLTYQSIETIINNGNSVAGLLQNIEADIFNNIIPKKSKFYYPLFDSIYFTDIDDCGSIIKQIKDKFSVYGIKPVLTINGETENDIEDIEIIKN